MGLFFLLGLILKLLVTDGHLSLQLLVRVLSGQESALFIFYQMRLPVILASLSTAFLMVTATMILQAISKNDLADPSALGYNNIAIAVLAILALYLPISSHMPYMAIVGLSSLSILFFSLVMYRYAMADDGQLNGNILLLLGIGVNAFFTMILTYVRTYSSEANDLISLLNNGNFDHLPLSRTLLFTGFSLVLIGLFLGTAKTFRLLQLDREVAASLGLNLPLAQFSYFALMSVCVAMSLLFGASFPFVAFTALHVARRFYANHLVLQFLTAGFFMAGAILISDVLAHQLFETILPTNLFLSVLGGVGFLIILLQRRSSWQSQ